MRLRKLGSVGMLVVAGGVFARPVPAQADPSPLDALSRELLPGLDDACTDAEIRDKALEDPSVLLDLTGVVLPEKFTLQTFRVDERPVEPVGPAIELTHCRTYWVCERPDGDEPGPCTWGQQEVCLGFRVVDTREVPGPIPPW
jgi:hypothetical protein